LRGARLAERNRKAAISQFICHKMRGEPGDDTIRGAQGPDKTRRIYIKREA